MLLAQIGTHALTKVVSACCNRTELTFNDTTLTILGRVTVVTPQGAIVEADPGHKDALRALIGHHVASVEYLAHNFLRLRFTSGVSIVAWRRRRYVNGLEAIELYAGVPAIVQHVA